MQFANKVAVVTAAGSGIGKASATAFARRGAKVVLGDLNAETGEAAAAELRGAGHEAIFVPVDVTDEEQVARLYAKAAELFGRIDFCHNNAGGGPSKQHFDASREVWDKGIALNLTSTFLCLKHQSPIMAKTGGGAIVNTSSGAGLRANTRSSIFYMAAKAGVAHMTSAAAVHFAPLSIRVNCVAPGLTGTVVTRMTPEEYAKQVSRIPLGRACTSEDIANTVVWLCSDEAGMVTGMTVKVDGGQQNL